MTETETQAESASNLESLKETWNQAKVTLRRLSHPNEEMRTICEAVRDAVATNRMGTEPEFAKWINEEVGIGVMQKLCKTATFDQNYVETAADTMSAFMDLFAHELKNKRYHENFTCAMTRCFKSDDMLHKRNFQMSNEELQKLSTANQVWRQQLKPGDGIDVKIDGDEKVQKIKGWVQGQVESIEGEMVNIIFPELPEDYDHAQPIWTQDIA